MTVTPGGAARTLGGERGFAVPIALAVMLITFVLAGVATAVAIDTNLLSNRDTYAKSALEAANAGLRTAMYRLNQYKPGDNNCPTVPTSVAVGAGGLCPQDGPDGVGLGNGESYVYWISRRMITGDTCTGPSVSSALGSVAQRCITVLGTANNGVTARVQQRAVAYTSTPVFPVAIFGTKSVTILNNASIVSDTVGVHALLGTNGQLVAGIGGAGNTLIDGYQLPPGASVTLGGNLTNTGPTTGIPIPYPVPTSIDPGTSAQNTAAPYDVATTSQGGSCSLAQAQAEGWSGTPASWVQTNCDYRIQRGITYPLCANGLATVAECDASSRVNWDPVGRTLSLSNNGSLVLGGGFYNFCSLDLGNNSQITIAANAQVSIFIDSPSDPSSGCAAGTGTFNMGNNSGINAGGVALNAQVYVYGDPNDTPPTNAVSLANNTVSSFLLAAPFSNVTISPSNNTIFRGAIVGYTVSVGNKDHFTYEADASSLQSGSLQRYYPSYWEQCPAQSSSPTVPTAGC